MLAVFRPQSVASVFTAPGAATPDTGARPAPRQVNRLEDCVDPVGSRNVPYPFPFSTKRLSKFSCVPQSMQYPGRTSFSVSRRMGTRARTKQHRTAPNSTEQHRTDQHQRER